MDQQELKELEQQCIQDCAPFCTAACPLHVDVRALLARIRQDDFSGALQILHAAVPFPGIVSRLCCQPCRSVCRRSELGGAIAVADLEQACVEFGTNTEPPAGFRSQQNMRIAVVGAGLAGLTAALFLRKKGFAVTVFEKQNTIGGAMCQFIPEKLDQALVDHEIGAVFRAGVELCCSQTIGETISWAAFRLQYDAILLATGQETQELPWAPSEVDSQTFALTEPGIFAAGGILRPERPYTAIHSMAEARRASISIDRYLHRVSLVAGRNAEGPYTSCLQTNLAGIPPQKETERTEKNGRFTRTEAVAEAGRCLQCQCLECVKNCTYLAHFKRYPRKYVREIYNNLSIVMGMRKANQLINSCSLCGLCKEVCPTGLDMGKVCKDARRVMVTQQQMPPSAHEFALRDMAFSNSPSCRAARHKTGETSSSHVFFPGCQLCASRPRAVEQIYEQLIEKTGLKIGIMLGCCGAPADWAGRPEMVDNTMDALLSAHRQMGHPTVIAACPSCVRMLRTRLPADHVVSLWNFLYRHNIVEDTSWSDGPLVIHDPCTARYDTETQDSVRQILAHRGAVIEELPLSRQLTQCCSFGGLVWFANRSLSREIIRRRTDQSTRVYVTYCAMCRDALSSLGKPVHHLLDIVLNSKEDPSRPMPSYSERRENRRRLCRRIMSADEKIPATAGSGENIPMLRKTDAVKKKIDDRFILDDDIRQVIVNAETGGRRLRNKKTHIFLTCQQLGMVTCWVEYSKHSENIYNVYNAYSHRMQIDGESQG